jgi:hypothetical protein
MLIPVVRERRWVSALSCATRTRAAIEGSKLERLPFNSDTANRTAARVTGHARRGAAVDVRGQEHREYTLLAPQEKLCRFTSSARFTFHGLFSQNASPVATHAMWLLFCFLNEADEFCSRRKDLNWPCRSRYLGQRTIDVFAPNGYAGFRQEIRSLAKTALSNTSCTSFLLAVSVLTSKREEKSLPNIDPDVNLE